jgi:hypothetical protein
MLAILGLVHTAYASEPRTAEHAISEAELRAISDGIYTELIRKALTAGHSFRADDIENGYCRHFEEMRLQLIGNGWTMRRSDTRGHGGKNTFVMRAQPPPLSLTSEGLVSFAARESGSCDPEGELGQSDAPAKEPLRSLPE